MKTMKTYLKIINLSFQNQMEYKLNFIMTFIYRLFPFAINILVWLSVSNTSHFLMSKSEIITYYMIGLVTSNLVVCSIQNEISDDIRNGTINKYLIKPISYFGYQLMKDVAFRFTFIILGIVPITISFYLMKKYITLGLNVLYVILFIVSVIIGYMINFFLSFLLSELSFYFTNVSVLFAASDVLKNIVSGAVFPLALLPPNIAEILSLLPFSYIAYFPTIILLEQYSVTEIILKLALGVLWCVALALNSRAVWRKGLKTYSSFGG